MKTVRRLRQEHAFTKFEVAIDALRWEHLLNRTYAYWQREDELVFEHYELGAPISWMAKVVGISAPALRKRIFRQEQKDWSINGMTPADMHTVFERERKGWQG